MHLTLPDNSIQFVQITKDQNTFRLIAQKIQQTIPNEFTILYDEDEKKMISKYLDELKPNKNYRLISIQLLLEQDQKLKQQNIQLESQKEEDRKKQLKLEQENSKLQEKIKQNDQLMEQLKSNKDNQSELMKQIQNKEKIITQQQQEIKDMKDEIASANDSIKAIKRDFTDQLEKQQKMNQSYSECIKQLEFEKKENDKQIVQMQQQAQQYVSKIQSDYQQYQVLQQQYSHHCIQLKNEFEQLQNEKKIIEAEQDKNTEKIRVKDRELRDFNQELQNLQQSNEKLQKELEDFKQKLKKQTTEFNNYKQDYEDQLEDKDKIINRNRIEINKLNQEKTRLESSLKTKENEFKMQIGQVQQNGERQAQFENLLKDTKEQYLRLQDENDELTNKIKQLQENLDQAKIKENKQKSEIENLKKQLENQINSSEVEKQRLENLLQEEMRKGNQINEQHLKNQQEQQENFSKERKKLNTDIQNLERQLNQIRNELTEKIGLLESQKEELRVQKNALLDQVNQQDINYLNKENELKALQNQANVLVYQQRITRLVELKNKEYISEIQFSIESINLKKVNFENHIKTNSKETSYDLIQVKLENKVKETLYYVSDQNFAQCATQAELGKIKGLKCSNYLPSDDIAFDKYLIFKCTECVARKDLVGKFLGIRELKKPDIQEPFSKETATNNCLSTLIAQEFMKQFIHELKNGNAQNIFEPKFKEQFIIRSSKSFKVYFKELLEKQQLVNLNEGFKFYCNFIELLDEDSSNDFFETIKVFAQKTLLANPRDKNSAITDENQMLKYFINLIDEPLKSKLNDLHNKANQDQVRKQFSYFKNFVGEEHYKMPILIYQQVQVIEILPKFEKYNGGHMPFDTTQYGKFLSAFSYYTIVKSEHQVCVSHLQGDQNQLFDPLVSTYDGFLDDQDQGFNEMRTIESKFLSEKHAKKGVEYVRVLGIKWQ